ncbi:MAG: hypothetical protein J6P02_05785 [Lachnospiraceae bacterium]|nr:hypothetical protein [Lachnospiraceae bacterium]
MKKMFRVVSLMIALTFAFSIFSFAYSPIIGDNYPQVYDLYWNNKTAKWSVDGRANKYEVRLYRDGRRVSTKTQTGRSRNFTSEMSRGDHEYYFEVRPYNSVTGWGNWEQSDSTYIEHYYPDYPDYPVVPVYPVTPVYPGTGTGPGEGTSLPTPQIMFNPVGQWVAGNGYWHYVFANGVYASNTWLQIGNNWYYIDINRNMSVGLVTINQYTYYFNPDGTMATGTIIYNGITHFFDANGRMVY